MNTKKMICALLVSGALSGTAIAQQAAPSPSASPAGGIDKEAIAKKLANPIANMISVQTQYQYSRGVGVNQAGSEQSLLFQPVLPFDLGGGDTFIVRPIVAGVREINVQGTSGSPFTGSGIASVTVESFYAPNTNSSWIWGVGPYAISPSGNSGKFGSQQTGAGVTGVVLNRQGPWTYGLLAYQSWEVGGNPAFGTQNNLYGQPFVAYTNKQAWTFTSNMEALYNYDTRRTSNPLYAGVSKVVVIDGLPFSFGAGPMYYVSNTPGGPSGWGARATVTLIILK
ncbi:MAG: transporter [Burkholderiaceae bacterium]|nr:transporter [Burkholderiaceae bacterium]